MAVTFEVPIHTRTWRLKLAIALCRAIVRCRYIFGGKLTLRLAKATVRNIRIDMRIGNSRKWEPITIDISDSLELQ